jgi:hypothetical protein
MTTKEFIQAKLTQFGYELSEIELTALLIDNNINDLDDYNSTVAKKAIVSIVPELLIKPSISEGDLSIKYDSNDIISYYNILCSELGVANKLTPQPKVRNLTNSW